MDNKPKIILGISGGVDSLVSAILLQEQGYHVIGVTLNLWKTKQANTEIDFIVNKLGIEHYYIDAQTEFKTQVVDYFIREYLSGRTPNPCTICNNIIKFKILLDFADRNNVNFIATGHYINIKEINNKKYFIKGIDKNKDQSYFLWNINNSYLDRIITPLGNYTKQKVKEIAKNFGFDKQSVKKESMSICFLENSNYRDFINKNIDKNIIKSGKVYDTNNNEIGTHKGIAYYTIGQKNDLNLTANKKLYVKQINAKENTLIVDETLNLYKNTITVIDYSFVDANDIKSENITILIRGFGLNPAKNAKIEIINKKELIVNLEESAWAIASGQPVVFYNGDVMLGGGFVK